MEYQNHQPLGQVRAQFNISAIFRQVFSNAELAEWLLSRDETPQLALTGHALSNSFCVSTLLSFDTQANLVICGIPQNNNELAEIQKHSEFLSYVVHSSGNGYCLATASYDRVPFAFLETVGAPLPGVRRVVLLKLNEACGLPKAHATIGYHWLDDGKSCMTLLCYSLGPQIVSEKHFLLLNQYPASRYPKMSDVLEKLSGIEEPICQYCIFRGNLSCQCALKIIQRMTPSLPSPSQQNDPWSLLLWNWKEYELGVRKYAVTLSNYPHRKAITLPVVHKVSMSDGARQQYYPADDRQGVQHYLAKLSPHFNRQMITSGKLFNTIEQVDEGQQDQAAGGSTKKRSRSPSPPSNPSVFLDVDSSFMVLDDISGSLEKSGSGDGKGDSNDNPQAGSNSPPGTMDITAPTHDSFGEIQSPSDDGDGGDGNDSHEHEYDGEQPLPELDRQKFVAYLDTVQVMPFSRKGECCNFCPPERQFFRRYDLARHVKTYHLRERRFACQYCESKFKRKSHLDCHVRTVHDKSVSFKCLYCDRIYTSDSTRRKHCRSVHNTDVYD